MRLLKEAFASYKEFCLRETQMAINEKSSEILIRTFEIRRMRQIFNAYCAFCTIRQSAKRKLRKTLQDVDLKILSMAVKKWKSNGNKKRLRELRETAQETREQIEERSRTISTFESMT